MYIWLWQKQGIAKLSHCRKCSIQDFEFIWKPSNEAFIHVFPIHCMAFYDVGVFTNSGVQLLFNSFQLRSYFIFTFYVHVADLSTNTNPFHFFPVGFSIKTKFLWNGSKSLGCSCIGCYDTQHIDQECPGLVPQSPMIYLVVVHELHLVSLHMEHTQGEASMGGGWGTKTLDPCFTQLIERETWMNHAQWMSGHILTSRNRTWWRYCNGCTWERRHLCERWGKGWKLKKGATIYDLQEWPFQRDRHHVQPIFILISTFHAFPWHKRPVKASS